MDSSQRCLVCDSMIVVRADVQRAEIMVCGDCGQEHEVLDVGANLRLGLAPEVEEDWGE